MKCAIPQVFLAFTPLYKNPFIVDWNRYTAANTTSRFLVGQRAEYAATIVRSALPVPLLCRAPQPLQASRPAPSFVHPTTVQEFYDFDPHYLERWLVSRNCNVLLIEDWAQDLYAHLCQPTVAGRAKGLKDKMGLYDPSKLQHRPGSPVPGIAAWADWLSGILERKYWKMISVNQRRNLTEGPKVISMGCSDVSQNATKESGMESWWLMLEPEERPLFEVSAATIYEDSKTQLNEVLLVVQDEIGWPAVALLSAMAESDSPAETAHLTGLTLAEIRKQFKAIQKVLASVLGLDTKHLQKLVAA